MLPFIYGALLLSCILFLLKSFHFFHETPVFILYYFFVAPFSCCILMMLQFFHVALFSSYTFSLLTFFSRYTLFLWHFVHIGLFSCCIFFMLHPFHIALSFYVKFWQCLPNILTAKNNRWQLFRFMKKVFWKMFQNLQENTRTVLSFQFICWPLQNFSIQLFSWTPPVSLMRMDASCSTQIIFFLLLKEILVL